METSTKKCPKCKNEINSDVLKCPHCKKDFRNWKQKKRYWVLLGLAVLLFWQATHYANKNYTPSATTDKSADIQKQIGQAGVLDNGIAQVLVAASKEALDKSMDISQSGDRYAMQEQVATGAVFLVDSGTKVQVIDIALFARQIRILEGRYQGKSGWIPKEFVK